MEAGSNSLPASKSMADVGIRNLSAYMRKMDLNS